MAVELFPRRRTSLNQRSALFPTPAYQPAPLSMPPPLETSAQQIIPRLEPGSPVDIFEDVPGVLDMISQGRLAGVPSILSPRSEQAQFMSFAGAPQLGLAATSAPASPTANAARLLSGAVSSNPFIDIPGLARLQQGYAPLLNEISPAFWETTSPTIRAALLGLYRSMGLRPEDIQHAFEQWRVPGIPGLG